MLSTRLVANRIRNIFQISVKSFVILLFHLIKYVYPFLDSCLPFKLGVRSASSVFFLFPLMFTCLYLFSFPSFFCSHSIARLRKPLLGIDEKGSNNRSMIENQATKRQKIDGGFLQKVHRNNLSVTLLSDFSLCVFLWS